jgi:acetoacetyl-CoA synthetase
VARLSVSLRDAGVRPGDRVAAYMPNLMETAVAMLAATSVGATWASCASDLGAQATIDRLGQIQPRVLFAADGYLYKAKTFSTISNVAEVAAAIPSVEKVVVVHYAGHESEIGRIPRSVRYEDFIARTKVEASFEQLPPDHPLVVMFSSGTTGKPKCMVQSAAGILVNRQDHVHHHLQLDDVELAA